MELSLNTSSYLFCPFSPRSKNFRQASQIISTMHNDELARCLLKMQLFLSYIHTTSWHSVSKPMKSNKIKEYK
uniref:Uncharacterized protein n=1 Tax=Gossypium raimondii TaxID=29730 RepID=A0A0D2V326_GOSRA|nr:hypothetical protein B456_010G054700 [Gossypium raimondii]